MGVPFIIFYKVFFVVILKYLLIHLSSWNINFYFIFEDKI